MNRREKEELDRMIEQDIMEAKAKELARQKAIQEEMVKQQQQATAVSTSQDVKENMAQVEKAIRNDDAIPSDVKDNLIIEANNERKVQESAARNLNMQGAPQSDGSIKSQFLDALTFFGPQIIGGLFGAAEGDAGMLAGAEMGGKLRDSYLDYNFKRQDQARANQQATGVTTKDIISQPFRLTDGSGWAFPRKVIDVATGQPVVKFYKEDGTEVSSSQVEEPQDQRVEDYQKLKKRGLTQQDVKIAEASFQNFVKPTTLAGKRLDNLANIVELQRLVDSNTSITGLIDFKMAKGIASEVGNLAEGERKAAAQIVGFKGKLDDLEQWITSNLTKRRKAEIQKLIDYIGPRTKRDIVDAATNYTRPRAKLYGMDEKQYRMFLLDSTGYDFSNVLQEGKKESSVDERRQKMINRIKNIRAKRGR